MEYFFLVRNFVTGLRNSRLTRTASVPRRFVIPRFDSRNPTTQIAFANSIVRFSFIIVFILRLAPVGIKGTLYVRGRAFSTVSEAKKSDVVQWSNRQPSIYRTPLLEMRRESTNSTASHLCTEVVEIK